MFDYTIVLPVYHNETSLCELAQGLRSQVLDALHGKRGRLIFVDDGSGDNSFHVLRALQAQHPEDTVAVRLSRNFGQVNAVWCGLSLADGPAVVMAADGQDTPTNALRLLRTHFEEGNEVVIALRRTRDESAYRTLTSRIAYGLMRRFCFPDMPAGGFDFFLLGGRARLELLQCYHHHGFIQGQILRLGFQRAFIACDRVARKHGRSRWTFSRKVTYLLDGILGYSFHPIRIMSLVGALVALLGFLYAGIILVDKLVWGNPIKGWAPLMIVLLITSGLQMLMLGVIGEYLWRTFAQVRSGQPYIVDECLDQTSGAAAGGFTAR